MWKANGKTTTLVLFLDSLFPKAEIHTHTHKDTHTHTHVYICEMLPLETKQSGDKLRPHSDIRGGVFLGEMSSSKNYSKNEKKKEQHSYKIGTWNIRTLNRGGKLENLKLEI